MTAAPPLDWIAEIDATLMDLEEKPQFGHAPSLDWVRFEKNLQKLFNQPHLKVTHQAKGWMASHHLLEGLGKEIMPLSVAWAPLHIPSFFVTDSAHLKTLIVELFETEEGAQYFYDTSLTEGFYYYFAAEMLHQLVKLHFSAPFGTPFRGIH